MVLGTCQTSIEGGSTGGEDREFGASASAKLTVKEQALTPERRLM